jgi:hypothetical protein
MGSNGHLLKDFIKHQMMSMTSTTPTKTATIVMDPLKHTTPEVDKNTMEYIISKKPKPPAVRKYLQRLINEIVAEQED